MEPVQLAAVLAGLVLLASVLSVELGISVALLELTLGVVAGNLFGLDFRERFGASLAIGHGHHAIPDPSGILTGPVTDAAEEAPA